VPSAVTRRCISSSSVVDRPARGAHGRRALHAVHRAGIMMAVITTPMATWCHRSWCEVRQTRRGAGCATANWIIILSCWRWPGALPGWGRSPSSR
jgi:hypothetical protein